MVEAYKPVRTIPVLGYSHDHIQGIPVELPNSPFTTKRFEGFSVVGINGEIDEACDPLTKISSIHNRSYEYLGGQKIVWTDEFGNLFTSMNSKGNNLSDPHLPFSQTASGVFVYGMQDSGGMVRMLNASRILRENNIETEAIVQVIEPLHLPYKGETLSLNDFKRRLVEDAIERKAILPENASRAAQILGDSTFFITVRAMPVNERLADLTLLKGRDLERAIKNAFLYSNRYEKIRAKKDPKHKPLSFNAGNSEDIRYYFSTYVPERIGQNLSKLHGLGLIHTFPTLANIAMVGALIDLDSISGALVGDNFLEANYHAESPDIANHFKVLAMQVDGFHYDAGTATSAFTTSYLKEAMKSKRNLALHILNLYQPLQLQTFEQNTTGPRVQPLDNPIREFIEYQVLKHEPNMPDPLLIASYVSEENRWNDGEPLSSRQRETLFIQMMETLLTLQYDELFGPSQVTPELKEFTKDLVAKVIMDKVNKAVRNDGEEIALRLGIQDPPSEPDHDSVNEDTFDKAFVHVTSQLGWERNIAKHAQDLEYVLSLDFRRREDKFRNDVMYRYIDLFTSQTGIGFSMRDRKYDLVFEFHTDDQEKAEAYQRIDDAGIAPYISGVDSMEGAGVGVGSYLQLKGPLYEYFKGRPASERYLEFVINYVRRAMLNLRLDEAILKACQDPDTARVIFSWFFKKWTDELLVEEQEEAMIDEYAADRLRDITVLTERETDVIITEPFD